jgi:SAM-dependent methyltransferase
MVDSTILDTLRLAAVHTSCPLCAAQEFKNYVTHPEVLWAQCQCGLIYLQAQSTELSKAAIYHEDYFTGGTYDARRKRRIAKSRHQLLDVLNHVSPGPVLDIGCSLGYTLQAARELGMESAGTDVSEFAVEQCSRQGFVTKVGTMSALPFADAHFGIVTMKHVLEHTPDPRAALQEVRRVLKPGGGLFIAVPDARYGKAARNPQRSRFYQPRGIGHFIYYTPTTLGRLLAEEGYRVVRVNPHLVHRCATSLRRVGQMMFAPLRASAQAVADASRLRKEFWLTAVRID